MFTPSSSFNQSPEWTLLFTSYDISLCFRLAALDKQVLEPDYLMLDTMKDIGPSTRMVYCLLLRCILYILLCRWKSIFLQKYH